LTVIINAIRRSWTVMQLWTTGLEQSYFENVKKLRDKQKIPLVKSTR
jgi:hypothetical protein